MKKTKGIVLVLSMLFLCVSCGNTEKKEEAVKEEEPQLTQEEVQSICELAVMECRYHNVAKYNEEDAEKFLWMKKDRKFWMEYSGTVKVGIDASKVTIETDGDNVYITMPPAKVFEDSCQVDADSLMQEGAIVVDKDFLSAKVRAEDQTAAMGEAQKNMLEEASKDTVLLENANQRARSLIRNYVEKVGRSLGKNYQVHFLDETGKAIETDEIDKASENQ